MAGLPDLQTALLGLQASLTDIENRVGILENPLVVQAASCRPQDPFFPPGP